MHRTVPFVLLLCFFSLSCAKKEAGFRTETVNGVKVVHNFGVKPEKVARTGNFVEDLSIGREEGPGDYLLYSPVAIDVDPGGFIYVLDSRDALIKQFDASGSFVKNIGRKGQGPGEFQSPNCMAIDPKGQIIVADSSSMRFTTLASSGDFVKSAMMKNYVSGLTCGQDGLLVAGYNRADGSAYCVGSLDIDTGQVFDLFSQEQYWPARVMNNKIRYDFPYLVRWALGSKDRLFVAAAVAYEISVLNIKGRLEFRFKRDQERIPVQGEMLEQVSGITLRGPNPYMRNPYYPLFESLAIDEQDRVWIQHYQPKWAGQTNRETPYDIFSPEGVFLFETRIPGHIFSQLVFKNGFIYALKKSDSGYCKAVRLKLVE